MVHKCIYVSVFIYTTIKSKVMRGCGWQSHIMSIQCEKKGIDIKKSQNIVEYLFNANVLN